MAYFPMYIDLTDKECLVCGGGNVALRKVRVLLDFGARVTVVALNFCPALSLMPDISRFQRDILPEDFEGKALVVAATDNRRTNHEIAEMARERKVPVNAVDQTEDCTFIFPSYLKEQNLVAAFSSSGKSPVITQYLKEQEKQILTPKLGKINEMMGQIRPQVKASYATEAERKAAYLQIFHEALEKEE